MKLRKLYYLIILIFIFTLATSSIAGNSNNESLSIEGLDSHDTEIFMAGMAYGIEMLNMNLLLDGKPQFICKSLKGKALTGKQLWSLANKALEGPHKVMIVTAAALDELKKKYPCKK